MLSESKIYSINEIPIHITLQYTENTIENLNLEMIPQIINNTCLQNNPPNRSQTVQNEIEYLWTLLDQYFQQHKLDHTAFLNHLKSKSEIYTLFSPFYTKVYEELCKTDVGITLTYKDLANKLGSKAFQAIGTAMKSNQFPILIPCHRVVAQTNIGGYMGLTSKLKMDDALFNLKNSEIYNNRAIPDPIKIKILLIKFEKS